MEYIMAVDQGTTSTRAILYNHKGQEVSIAQREITQSYPNPGWVEQDANEIWLKTIGAISDCIITSFVNNADIRAIGITNQRETTVIWDKRTGAPIAPAIVWQSRQSLDICNSLIANNYEDLIKEKTGLKIDAYFSASKIRFILDSNPHYQEMAEAGELLFGTIDSWLIWKLTNGQVHATDYTNASRTLLFNIHSLKWDQQLLNIFNIPESMLPQVKQSSEIYGHTAPKQFMGMEVPIAGVAGDQHAALFGQQCLLPGMVKNTYGTGCFMLMNTGNAPKTSDNGLLTTIAWVINGEVTYALEGSVFVAGSSIQWLRDGLEFIEDARESEQLAKGAHGDFEVFVVPAFVGLGTPYWDANARGAMFGLTRGTGKAEITKATLEAICYQTRDVLETMKLDSDLDIKDMLVDGDACANDYLMQFQADITATNVVRPHNIETTALGASFLAGLATSFWTMEDISNINHCDIKFTSKITNDEREQLYSKWKCAVAATRMFKD